MPSLTETGGSRNIVLLVGGNYLPIDTVTPQKPRILK